MVKTFEERAAAAGAESHADADWSTSALHALAPRCDYDGRKLARMFKVSQRQLQRLFSERFSCSPQAWLNQQRLLVARDMLGSADSIKEVAYSLGFRRTSQFSRDFRRMFGLTPSQAHRLASSIQSARGGAASQNFAGAMRSERQRGQRPGEL